MLYVSKNARPARWAAGRTWLAVGYALAGVVAVIMLVAACRAQADRVEDSLSGALSGTPAPAVSAAAPAGPQPELQVITLQTR